MRQHRRFTLALFLSCWCGLFSVAALQAAEKLNSTFSVTLSQALPYKPRNSAVKPWKDDLHLDLVCRDGVWSKEVWGWTTKMPGQEHLGELVKVSQNGDLYNFEIKIEINNNRLRPGLLGGDARYKIEVLREGEKLSGKFEGETEDRENPEYHQQLEKAWGWGVTLEGHAFMQPLVRLRTEAYIASAGPAGKVTGSLTPLLPVVGSHEHFKSGEHPRLFFTKEQIPELRRRAQTPLGQKIVERIKWLLEEGDRNGIEGHNTGASGPVNVWAAGWGLLYQLTGDKKYAQRAAGMARGWFYGAYPYGQGGKHSSVLLGTAIAYDLCYDAWDEEDRAVIYAYLEKNIRELAMRHDGVDILRTDERYTFHNPQENFSLQSPENAGQASFRAGAALAALVLMNDPPPAFKPTPMDQVKTVEPAHDYEPWLGVPVLPFEAVNGRMGNDWLVNGPFKRGTVDQYMEQVGGCAGVRPEPGTIVQVDGYDLDFRRLPLLRPIDSPQGPKIYCRDEGRYWTSSTGGGYWPGIELNRKWAEQIEGYNKRLGLDVVIYTVIRNDKERVIQMLANWRNASQGIRAWLNGTPIQDGELVRIKPGLYPLTYHIPLAGGYSAHAPHLREYTPRIYDQDMQIYHEAQQAFMGRTSFDNQMIRNLNVLQRSLRRFIATAVDEKGWGGWYAHHTLLPYIVAFENIAGFNLAKGTGLENTIQAACRIRRFMDTGSCNFIIANSFSICRKEDLGLARWYQDTFGLGIHRPVEGMILLSKQPFDLSALHPSKVMKLHEFYPGYGVHVFHDGWEGEKSSFFKVEDGAGPICDPQTFANFMIHSMGRRFTGGITRNQPLVLDCYPVSQGKLLHRQGFENGSGTVATEMNDYREGGIVEGRFRIFHDKNPKIRIFRSIGVDYSGKSGAPMVVAMVDRYTNCGRMEKKWHFDFGDMELAVKRENRPMPAIGLFLIEEQQRMTAIYGSFRGQDEHPLYRQYKNMQMQIYNVAPAKLEYKTITVDKYARQLAVEAIADRRIGELEKVSLDRAKELAKNVVGDASARNKSEAVEDPQEKRMRELTNRSGKNNKTKAGDPLMDELLGEINAEMQKEQQQKDKALPPLYFFTVMTVHNGKGPEIKVEGSGHHAVVQVGGQTVRFDGTKILFGE